jgi:hypothetical protein
MARKKKKKLTTNTRVLLNVAGHEVEGMISYICPASGQVRVQVGSLFHWRDADGVKPVSGETA